LIQSTHYDIKLFLVDHFSKRQQHKYASAGSALTRMASSAPIARALRIVGSADVDPTCATVTDLTPLDASPSAQEHG